MVGETWWWWMRMMVCGLVVPFGIAIRPNRDAYTCPHYSTWLVQCSTIHFGVDIEDHGDCGGEIWGGGKQVQDMAKVFFHAAFPS